MDERIEPLLRQGYQLPYGDNRVAVFEEAVRIADNIGDDRLAYSVRMDLVDSATWSGHIDKALVAFSYCLAYVDRPDCNLDLRSVLWSYKWIVGAAWSQLVITRDQIENLQEDLSRRYEAAGYNQRAVECLRWINLSNMGDLERAKLHFDRWRQIDRDSIADCRACEPDNEVDYHVAMGENEQAVELAQKIIDGHFGTCSEVPMRTYGRSIRPLMRLGRLDEAEGNFRAGIRKTPPDIRQYRYLAEYLMLLVRTDDLRKAVGLLDRNLPLLSSAVTADGRFRLYLAASLVFKALAARGNRPRKFRLPQSLPCYQEDNTYQSADLFAWFHSEAEDLARRFDIRNGSRAYAARISESLELAGLT